MKLLLDTSAFLWWITRNPKMPTVVMKTMQSPDHLVWLSAVSFWEIQVKHQLGKLPLPEAPATYIPRQRQRHGVEALPLQEEAIVHVSRLPALHRDPFDRMLVCQAIEHDLTIVTSDPVIRGYPVKTWWG